MLENFIYCDTRIGKKGKPFTIYKIKTMKDGSISAPSCEEGLIFGKQKNNPNIIKNRRWLRTLFIDEMPQIANILKGDMVIFGLRPYSEKEFKKFPEEFKEKYVKFKPGIMCPIYLEEINSFGKVVEINEKYLDDKIRHGIASDVKYFYRMISRFFSGDLRGV